MTDLIAVDAVYGMWQGERICEIMGFTQDMGHVWTNDTMLDYFEKLVECHDLFVSTNGYMSNTYESIEPLCLKGFTRLVEWKHIRNAVLDYTKQFPDVPVIDIIEKLGITLEQFFIAVTVNKKSNMMTRDQFIEFCNECLGDKPNFAKIGRDYGTGVNTMVYFKKLFRAIKLARTK